MSFGQDVRANLNAPLRLDDLWKWGRVIAAIFFFGGFWATIYAKLDDCNKGMRAAAERGERIERYLSSKDPNYWETSKKME